jgi:hypothetical protein
MCSYLEVCDLNNFIWYYLLVRCYLSSDIELFILSY